ncbi:MAG: dihydroneopterin aldolase [Bacteroidetes bacterium]|nr:dihydroneopterin aldolase [Bacteroidota bacterium]
MEMFTVFVKEQRILARTGWYADERANGVPLSISVDVELRPSQKSDELNSTLNYTDLVDAIRAEAKVEYNLLETLAQAIASRLQQQFPQVCSRISVEICKKNVPHSGFDANHCGVRYVIEL